MFRCVKHTSLSKQWEAAPKMIHRIGTKLLQLPRIGFSSLIFPTSLGQECPLKTNELAYYTKMDTIYNKTLSQKNEELFSRINEGN